MMGTIPSLSNAVPEAPVVDDIGAFSTLLAQRYDARAVTLQPLKWDGDKHLYRVERVGRHPWLLHVAPSQANPDAFRQDATVLALLERQAYPAPRVVPTLDGAAVTEWRQRPILVTTFIEGEPMDFSP